MEEKARGAETVEEITSDENEKKERAAENVKASNEPAKKEDREKQPEKRDRNRDLDYFIEKVENPDIREYIRTRVDGQMKYYSEKSRYYRKQFQRLTGASIILGALIPVASILSDTTPGAKVIIAALGSAVTAINAFLALYNSRDFWITYRNTRETLLRTLYYYFNHTGNFGTDRNGKEKTQEELDKLLVQCCEKELASENGSWRSIVEE